MRCMRYAGLARIQKVTRVAVRVFRAYRVASQPARQAGRHVWVRRVCASPASDDDESAA